MAQKRHQLRPGRERNGDSPLDSHGSPGLGRMGQYLTLGALLVVACGAASPAFGGNGPGIGFKIGAQTLESPITLDKTTRTRYEIELSSQLFLDNHLDFALTLGGSSLGSFDTDYVELIDDVLYEDYYTDDLSVLDVRLAARLYPFGDSRPIRPYVGAGVGYFWFLSSWEGEHYQTIEDPDFPGSFITFVDTDEDTETLADGFFPFILGGMTVPIGEDFEFLFEFQFDFEKEDSGFNLGGPIYMFGARFRF